MSGDIMTFLNWPSVFITIGGTLGALIVSFPLERIKKLPAIMKKTFVNEEFNLAADIESIVGLAEVARRNGLLALEGVIDQHTKNDFLKKGVLLLVDGVDRDHLRAFLQTEIYYMQQRHKKGYAMIDMIASTAPALGLLGTYIGLIPMLQNLEDPSKLGPLMAVELVTSFYGAFLAYVIFAPMSKKLKAMNEDEATRKEILTEGLTAIQEGRNPRLIREELTACLAKDPKRKNKVPDVKPEVGKVYSYGNR